MDSASLRYGQTRLVGEDWFRDLLEVSGAVEVAFGVALEASAGVGIRAESVVGGGGDADGEAVAVESVAAGDGEQVVPAAGAR